MSPSVIKLISAAILCLQKTLVKYTTPASLVYIKTFSPSSLLLHYMEQVICICARWGTLRHLELAPSKYTVISIYLVSQLVIIL